MADHDDVQDNTLPPVFQISANDLQDYICPVCLDVIDECFACDNGHRFCLRCVGEWAVYQLTAKKDGVAVLPLYDPFIIYVSSWLRRLYRLLPGCMFPRAKLTVEWSDREAFHRQVVSYPHSDCPMCRTEGPFRSSPEMDSVIAALPVSCPLDVIGLTCRWTGSLRDFSDHQHVFYDPDPPQGDDPDPAQSDIGQQRSVVASAGRGTKRRRVDDVDEDTDEARPAKSFRFGNFDVSILGYRVAVGLGGIEVNGELSVREDRADTLPAPVPLDFIDNPVSSGHPPISISHLPPDVSHLN